MTSADKIFDVIYRAGELAYSSGHVRLEEAVRRAEDIAMKEVLRVPLRTYEDAEEMGRFIHEALSNLSRR